MKKLIASVLSLSLLTNCAAMFNGKTEHVILGQSSSQLNVFIDGNERGKAGETFAVPNNRRSRVELKNPETQEVVRRCTIDTRTSAGYVVLDVLLLWFFLLPGIIAIVVDAAGNEWAVVDTSYCDAL